MEKPEINQQISLDISLSDNKTFENYYFSGNELVFADIENLIQDSQVKILYLWGGSGCGKSHLLQAVQSQEIEKGRKVYYLPFSNVKNYPVSALEGLETADLVCLDEIEQIVGSQDWEEAIFHLLNRIWGEGNQVLIAANKNVHELEIRLPDLESRLSWGLNSRIISLDDNGKLKCIQFRAKLRGFEIPEEVGLYLIKRLPRDMEQLFDFLDVIDKESLVAKRKITIPFVKSLLDLQTVSGTHSAQC